MTFTPRPHQLAAVARIITEPAVGLFHEVGAGKTAEMAIGAMELRRLGLVGKPAIVVPNHMLEQFAREFLQLYPQARLPGRRPARTWPADAAPAVRRPGRHRRLGRRDHDPHRRSSASPVRADTQRPTCDRELDDLRRRRSRSADSAGRRPRLTVKRLEAAARPRRGTAQEAAGRGQGPGLTFEETGIDYLFVDEAHDYKNLRTASNIPGVAIDGLPARHRPAT